MSDFDLPSFRNFDHLCKDVIKSEGRGFNILGTDETEYMFEDYDIYEDLIVVGFNEDDVYEGCGIIHVTSHFDRIPMPEECDGITCLCLCKKEGLIGASDFCKNRICFGFEDVDYFVGDYKYPFELGYGFNLPGNGQFNYLVLFGSCNVALKEIVGSLAVPIPNLELWNMRDINVEEIEVDGRTLIKIKSVT